MNRIEARMDCCKKQQRKAFITYMTAGLPDLDTTREIIKAQQRGGCDVVELGIPFSDPVADGPVIQAASCRAIAGGANLEKTFAMMRDLRAEGVTLPVIFMMYYNTILHYGVEVFVRSCHEAGVDGLIIPDLPYEEQAELAACLGDSDQTILIQLVSPVSEDRIQMLLANARGFVYCVSSMGVTGQGGSFHREVSDYLKKVRAATKLPVMLGFGIRTAADVTGVRELIDGAIVGSYFIELMEEHGFDPETAEAYCRTFLREFNETA